MRSDLCPQWKLRKLSKEQLTRYCDRFYRQRTNLARGLSGSDDGMARRDDRVDEAGLAASSAIVGRPITNIEKALMAHYLRHQQAGSPVRNQTVWKKGDENVVVVVAICHRRLRSSASCCSTAIEERGRRFVGRPASYSAVAAWDVSNVIAGREHP